jgi:hypothetical protein
MLNDAYRMLEDPLRRTEYLLKPRGAAIGEIAVRSEASFFQDQGKFRARLRTCSKKSSNRRCLRTEHAAGQDSE